MPTYIAHFTGRKVGAIGTCGMCSQTVRAENEEKARIALYDTHEHIGSVRFVRCEACSTSEDVGVVGGAHLCDRHAYLSP